MAGSSELPDGPALDCFKTLQELHSNGVFVKCGEIDATLKKLFNQLVSRVLKEICGSSFFRPFPPMLGEGSPVELLKLYLSVREKGGYEIVTRNGLWDLVAKESGFDLSVSTNLKLVYVKYLGLLDEWFSEGFKDRYIEKMGSKGSNSVETKLGLKGFLSDVKMRAENVLVDDTESCVGSSGAGQSCADFEVEDESSRKRKKECYLPLLDWMKRVAKDPCDSAVGMVPERSKWKAYGSQHVWKQVLLARESMLVKVNVDSKAGFQHTWQKKQKMHPEMYEDRTERPTSRCSRRLILTELTRTVLSSSKTPARHGSKPSTATRGGVDPDGLLWLNNYKRTRTPLGRFFQAAVPEWTGEARESEGETRFLGTPVWPLEKGETVRLIERAPIGKGRQDSCGCQFPGSFECVRFHVSEKRVRVELELGSAFAKWRFDEMGEGVSAWWARTEEKRFENIIRSNPESSGVRFWDRLSARFKNKTTPVLVSYYFNVYLLRRRAHQNRFHPGHIDSDDDELEKVGRETEKSTEKSKASKIGRETEKSKASILCPPKKPRLNGR